MRVGFMAQATGGLAEIGVRAREMAADGPDTLWFPQLLGVDAIGAITALAATLPDVELGTAVVATQPRHPVLLAQAALTAQAASGGRLTLGIGVSHQFFIEGMLGLSYAAPVRHLTDYLAVLRPALEGNRVDHDGHGFSAHLDVAVDDAAPPPVLLAALGPRMLRLAGEAADGTITWMTGPRTLADHTVPAITGAAAAAGRPAPRIVAGLPVLVTADVEAGRAFAARAFRIYGDVPSYRAMLDREKADGPADVAVIGDEQAVAAAVARLATIGVTDLLVAPLGPPDERARTRRFLVSLCSSPAAGTAR